MKNTLLKLGGAGLFLFGAAAPILSRWFPVAATPQWYGEVGGCILGGIVLFLFGTDFKLPSFSMPTLFAAKEDESNLSPSKLQAKDMDSLFYLSARARKANDQELLRLMKHVERKFFCIHHEIENEKVIEDNPTTVNTESVPK